MRSSIRPLFRFISCPCVFYFGCASERRIWVLNNQVEIVTKSPSWERWNPIWTFGHLFSWSTVTTCLKYILSRPGETRRCSNALLRFFSVAHFDSLKNPGKCGRPLLEKPVSGLWHHGLGHLRHHPWSHSPETGFSNSGLPLFPGIFQGAKISITKISEKSV